MRFSAFVGKGSEDVWYISPPLAAKPPVFPPPPGVPCGQRTGGTHAQRGSTRYCPGVQPTQGRVNIAIVAIIGQSAHDLRHDRPIIANATKRKFGCV